MTFFKRISFLIIIFFVFISCKQNCFDALERDIKELKPQELINFHRDYSCIKWDYLVIVPPYCSEKEITLNFDNKIKSYKIEANNGDTSYLIYFLDSEKVFHKIKISRQVIDFYSLIKTNPRKNHEGIFLLKSEECIFKKYDTGQKFSKTNEKVYSFELINKISS